MSSEEGQRAICAEFGSPFLPPEPQARIAVAIQTMHRIPVHGLRHPPHGNMEGWYIWAGEYSEDPNFFQVLHIEHLEERFPIVVKFLALEPGFRFLTDSTNMDVWRDPSLLQI